jgi:flavin reductase (DIM6/NTAB) family NADH-FMN oxidoreductase RutF
VKALRRLTPDEFREVIGHFATGVTIVTAVHDGRPYGTTASAVTSLSLEPPMLLVCMNKESETGKAMAATGHFAVNILGEGQEDLALRFAAKGGDKFEGVASIPGDRGEPLLSDALATLECNIIEQTTGGTHVVFFGEVERASAREGAPLAYYRGQFGRLQLTLPGAPGLDSPAA